MARKNLVLLKQAAIILQAHWKGRSARRQFVVSLAEEQERIRLETEEKERQRLEEENRRKEEEERRKEREEKEKAEALQREQEERERQGTSLYNVCIEVDIHTLHVDQRKYLVNTNILLCSLSVCMYLYVCYVVLYIHVIVR